MLDFLITRHFCSTHPGVSPGLLTDLRSSAVNNESFARAAVKYNIQKYLRHDSEPLMNQITKSVNTTQLRKGNVNLSILAAQM